MSYKESMNSRTETPPRPHTQACHLPGVALNGFAVSALQLASPAVRGGCRLEARSQLVSPWPLAAAPAAVWQQIISLMVRGTQGSALFCARCIWTGTGYSSLHPEYLVMPHGIKIPIEQVGSLHFVRVDLEAWKPDATARAV